MYRLLLSALPLLADAGLAGIVSTSVGALYNIPFSGTLLFWTLFWAYAPDLDTVLLLVKKGHIASDAEHPIDHRDGLHYPLGWLVFFGILFSVFGVQVWTVSACIASMFHFIHDLTSTGWGVQVFAPFDRGSYRIFSKKWVPASMVLFPWYVRYTPEEKKKAIRDLGEADWIRTYYTHITPVSLLEYSVFFVGVCAVVWWFFSTL